MLENHIQHIFSATNIFMNTFLPTVNVHGEGQLHYRVIKPNNFWLDLFIIQLTLFFLFQQTTITIKGGKNLLIQLKGVSKFQSGHHKKKKKVEVDNKIQKLSASETKYYIFSKLQQIMKLDCIQIEVDRAKFSKISIYLINQTHAMRMIEN